MKWLGPLLIAASSATAFGQTSCLPSFTALQTVEVLSSTSSSEIWRPLLTQAASRELVSTKARLHLWRSAEVSGELNMSFQFEPGFEGVSLPFNVYAVSVIVDGQPWTWLDFTRGCEGPGLSFFPGAEIRLPSVKLIGDKPQKLQIMVWGRI
jgi:hypothetical protein